MITFKFFSSVCHLFLDLFQMYTQRAKPETSQAATLFQLLQMSVDTSDDGPSEHNKIPLAANVSKQLLICALHEHAS